MKEGGGGESPLACNTNKLLLQYVYGVQKNKNESFRIAISILQLDTWEKVECVFIYLVPMYTARMAMRESRSVYGCSRVFERIPDHKRANKR